MKCRATSSLGAVLIAAVIVSLFPTSLANPAANYQIQSSASRASRGKTSWQSSKQAMREPDRRSLKRRAQNYQSGQAGQRREPPPFDRPPLASTSPPPSERASARKSPSQSSSGAATSYRDEGRTDSQSLSRSRTVERERLPIRKLAQAKFLVPIKKLAVKARGPSCGAHPTAWLATSRTQSRGALEHRWVWRSKHQRLQMTKS